jgi:hypothetical protein
MKSHKLQKTVFFKGFPLFELLRSCLLKYKTLRSPSFLILILIVKNCRVTSPKLVFLSTYDKLKLKNDATYEGISINVGTTNPTDESRVKTTQKTQRPTNTITMVHGDGVANPSSSMDSSLLPPPPPPCTSPPPPLLLPRLIPPFCPLQSSPPSPLRGRPPPLPLP